MEKIEFTFADSDESVDFFVLEQTTLNGTTYILVTEEEFGDSEAYILKAVPSENSEEDVYEMVEDETEIDAIAPIFEEMLDDVELEK